MQHFTSKHASIFYFLILFISFLNGQNNTPLEKLVQQTGDKGISFQIVQPFFVSETIEYEAATFAKNAQFLTLNLLETSEIGITRPQGISIFLPFKNEEIEIELVRTEIFSDDFKVTTSRSNAAQKVDLGVHYRGVVVGESNSLVSMSFFADGEVMGIISTPARGNLVLGKLDLRGNQTKYILYSDQDVETKRPVICHTAEKQDLDLKAPNLDGLPEVGGCVRLYLEADYELFQNKTTVQGTVNYLVGVFNQMATLYANEQINVYLSQLFVWVTPDSYSTTNAGTVLNQFQALRTSFNGNLAHLTGLGGNGNLGGIGYVDVLCFSGYNYSYSNIYASYSTVPTYSWTVEVMTHEVGHNLGSNHTHWCGWTGGALDNCYTTEGGCTAGPAPTNGGTIMSYCHLTSAGINFSNGFGSQPGTIVRNRVVAATCLNASCPTFSCDAPVSMTLSNLAANSATISWAAVTGAVSYTLRYRVVGSSTWTTISNAVSPTNLTGLTSNANYEISVRTNCSSSSSEYVNGMIFTTSSGGTICPSVSGVSFSNITTNSATAVWNAPSGALSYNVSHKLSSSTTWSANINTTSTIYNMSGLSAGTGYDVRVQAVCSGGTTAGFVQTSFVTVAAVSCGTPATLSAGNVTSSGATMTWAAVSGATYYNISYKLNSATTWGATSTTTATSVVLNGLSAATSYNFRVQAVCTGGSTSSYLQTTFTTLSASTGCGTPTNLAASSVSSSGATISWAAVTGASSYQLQYKLSTATKWSTAVSVTGTSRTLSGLTASSTYNVQVRAVCSSGNSAYATVNFTTLASPTCNPPANLSITNLTKSSATVNWTASSNGTSYRVSFKKASATNWGSEMSTTALSRNLIGLSSGTAYNVRIRTACSFGNSVYVQINFTTPAALPHVGEVENVIANESLSTTGRGSQFDNHFDLQLAPNPAHEVVRVKANLSGTDAVAEVQVLDLLGRQLLTENVVGENINIQLPLNELRPGVYLVRLVESGNVLGVRRLVKK